MIRAFIAIAFFCLSVQLQARTAPEHVQVSLVASVAQAAPGESFRVLFKQEIDEGWHTYWKNPGDSGAPPEIVWDLPGQVTASEFSWPYPERIPFGPLMNFGYHDTVLLPFTVNVPEGYESRELTIAGSGRVLVCADICIPQKVNLSLQLPVGERAIAAVGNNALFATADGRLPVVLDLPAAIRVESDRLLLDPGLPVPENHRITDLAFFPEQPEVIDHMAEQPFTVTSAGIEVSLKPGLDADLVKDLLKGVLVVTEDAGSLGNANRLESGYVIEARVLSAAGQAGSSADALSLPLAILLAFLGGVILNLMPCVFPVLSIKVLSLVSHHEKAAYHGLVYAAGVVLSFMGVALLLVLLRSSGEVIGWGFQLQSPLVVGALVYLFLVIALNLLGVFEVGDRLMQLGTGGEEQGYAASFSTGVLATVVAAPCTAPFMGAAVGFALTQSMVTTLLVFAALGAGMAIPLLLLTLSPGLVKRMPKPGRWMEVLRQLLAFPMLASMIWLAWVLGVQVGATGMMQILAGALSLAFGLWAYAAFASPVVRWPLLLVSIATAGYLLVSLPVAQSRTVVEVSNESGFPAGQYSVAALAEARQSGPVFVNFTAAWCITCKVNELNALNSSAVRAVFRDEGVTYLKGDWTNEDPEITRALESHGRSGVPLYLFYPRDSDEPDILPQLLTPGIVVAAVRGRKDAP